MGEAATKRIDIKEFRAKGYLQEANRLFFHPLGLALEVVVHDDGTESLGGVWDFRDDPEGMMFDEEQLDPRKTAEIEQERLAKMTERIKALGWHIQPCGKHGI